MRKLIFFFSLPLVLVLVYRSVPGLQFKETEHVVKPSSQVKSAATQKPTQFLFVPYWTLQNDEIKSDSDEFIYFGISVDEHGIDKNEIGYKKIDQFVHLADAAKKKLLVVRMTDSKTNFSILRSKKAQQDIINSSIQNAKQHGFSGIVLDLEIVSIPFQSITSQINAFVDNFQKECEKQHLGFALTLPGDTFYRIRPYDVVFLAKHTDRIFVMAYNFHKADANPGPNFPFSDSQKYGYDFKTMTSDFLNIVPKEKLVIVFGLFGYDWNVAQTENRETAQSLSFLQIKQKFLDNCQFKHCSAQRDVESSEQKVEYMDSAKQKHIVWFEDMESVEKKKAFLKEKGIEQVSFWAYSFF